MTGKLFGIVGYIGSGKSTTTDIAIKHMRLMHRMGFSDPMHRMMKALGIPDELLNDKSRWNEPVPLLQGKTLRHAFQTLGTEWGRNCIDPMLWTAAALERAALSQNIGESIIIDNVRFPTEFDAMRKQGAIMIAFERVGQVPDLSHESEQHIAELQAQCDDRVHNVTGEQSMSAYELRSVLRVHLRLTGDPFRL